MEEKRNTKLIYVIIILSILMGIAVWCALNLVYSKINPKEEAEKFVGEISVEEPDIQTKENEVFSTENASTIDFFEEKLIYNNNEPVTNLEGYSKKSVLYRQTGHEVVYYVPDSWNKGIEEYTDGVRVRGSIWNIEEYGKKSYEEILEIFKTKITNEASFPNSVELSTRQLNINGSEYTLIVMESYYNLISTYFCLVREGYVYYLSIHASKDVYNNELIHTIDTIMSTYKIIY